MSEVLLLNVAEYETRVAVLFDGVLQAMYLERESSRSITGNIYAGRVVRILPGIQAAFVDFGVERPGFLHVNEIPGEGDIQNILHDGQMILVQVSKEQIANKGARLSMMLSIASRTLVVLLDSAHIGVSQKITEPEEKQRLRDMVLELRKRFGLLDSLGFIVRTNARFADEQDLAQDLNYLKHVWEETITGDRIHDSPGLVYEEVPIYMRVVRDLACSETQLIKIDDADAYSKLRSYMKLQTPHQVGILELENPELSIFDSFNIENEISVALLRKVTLKSGGTIVIEQTEAMVTIDVNTGAYVGNRGLEETVYRTNLEAAREIPRQLRLKNLGGIIVIDFIDMLDPEHQLSVLGELEKAAEKDPERTRISGFSELGLVEMTRKRDRESLARQMGEVCRVCDGMSVVKSTQTVCYEIFRTLKARVFAEINSAGSSGVERGARRNFELRLSSELADTLQNKESGFYERQLAALDVQVELKIETGYERSQFDLVGGVSLLKSE